MLVDGMKSERARKFRQFAMSGGQDAFIQPLDSAHDEYQKASENHTCRQKALTQDGWSIYTEVYAQSGTVTAILLGERSLAKQRYLPVHNG